MSEFKGYHPLVNLIYFAFAIVMGCVFMHPAALGVSFVCAFTYFCLLKGGGNRVKSLKYILPALLVMAIINPLFNHQGATILAYFPSGNPLTAESVLYGIVSSAMIISIILFFACFSEVMTSDKLIYLFGKAAPSLSLVFSMTLGFVPRFVKQFKETVDSRKCVGRDTSRGSIIMRAKNGLAILSVMVSRSLEDSIDTADSMKSRGYGLAGRTAFCVFFFSKRDIAAMVSMLALAGYVIWGGIKGQTTFTCFPETEIAEFSVYGFTVFAAYFLLLSVPVIIEIWEVIKWKYIHSKM